MRTLILDLPRGSLRHEGNINDRSVPPEEKGWFPPGVNDGQSQRSGKRAQTFPLLVHADVFPHRGIGVKVIRDDDVNTGSAVPSCTRLDIPE